MAFCRAQLSWGPSMHLPPAPTTISKFFISFFYLFLFFLLSTKNRTWQLSAVHAASDSRVGEVGATVSDDLWGVCLPLPVCVCVSLSHCVCAGFSAVSVCSCQTMWRRLVLCVLSVRVLPQCDIVVVAVTNVVISTQLLYLPSRHPPGLFLSPPWLSACLSQCLHMKPQTRQIKHRQIHTGRHTLTLTHTHTHTHPLSIPGQGRAGNLHARADDSSCLLCCSLLNKKEK